MSGANVDGTAATDGEQSPTKKQGSSVFGGLRQHRMIEVLRIGLGLVWVSNLAFIVYPPNNYFGNFSATALTFAPVSFGGAGFPDYVSAHPLFFSWLVALITGYLAIAFTFGLTTRIACFVGSFFSAALFAIQIGTIFIAPGGTDVGEHPLYILINGVLLVGGAGRSLSLDAWLERAWARYRVARPAVVRPTVPSGWTGPWTISTRTLFTYFVAGTLVSLGVGIGLTVAFPLQSSSSGTPPVFGPTTYQNLSVNVAANGWPQYTPANFTLHTGVVVFTIVDNDTPMNWTGCPCSVLGTVGGIENVNGTPLRVIQPDNVAHSFSVPALNLAIWSPGQSIVTFTVDVTRTGELVWVCVVPCGTGADPYNTPPMGTPGYMTGTINVV
jgi:hypothetical protein